MCGIAGIVSFHSNNELYSGAIEKMALAIAHRGPDSQGIWKQEDCYLAHRRLSIIDLSDAGNQPFLSSDGRYVLIYNGELYNYKQLKLELQRVEQGSKSLPYIFKTNTDTEVVLASFIRWGKECLTKFNGMFAFAIWDKEEKRLFIARDRMGIKPLYYSFQNNFFCFASEIRSILKSGLQKNTIHQQAFAEFIQYATVHAPNTIIKGISMLMPGHFLELHEGKCHTVQYWNINQYAKNKQEQDYKQTCRKVNELLTHSVERRLVADVPFGAFLSGGIDSSAIVGLMSKVSSEPIDTFNVTFDESEFSESVYAKQIAQKYNTRHHEIKLTPQDFLNQLPEALQALDHPSVDGINSYIVSKATKKAGVTMALSGLGGDELFAGYDIFKRFYELEKKAWLNIVPVFSRKVLGKAIELRKKSVQGDKTAEILSLQKVDGLNAYPINRKFFSEKDYKSILKHPIQTDQFIKKIIQLSSTDSEHILSRVSLFEIQTYMQNVLLRDTDQMSMAVALEVRVPFLDYHLVQYALGIPDEHKYPHTPKKLLVDSLGDILPNDIVNRPKMGFVLPWQNWLKEDLKSFAEKNIIQFSKRSDVNEKAVMNLWNRFLANDVKISWSRIWHLIILNHWLELHQIES
jgi:asparagine synthase (glutamine-hydrolysing)